MKKIFILLFAIFAFFSCVDSNEGLIESANCELPEIRIRLSNTSVYDFSNIKVNSNSETKNFGFLEAGKNSDYQAFELAFKSGFVELEIKGQTFTIQAPDYTGETPLTNGAYTYVINATDSQERFDRLRLEFIEVCVASTTN